MTDRRLVDLERLIGRILRGGVAASTALMAVGLGLWFAGAPEAGRVIDAGLGVLIAVPVSRIAASFVDAVRRGDWLLARATGVVLAVLALTIAYVLS